MSRRGRFRTRHHLRNRALAPPDVYYPGNIVVRLLLGRRLEASGGGQCARRARFVAFHAPERLQAKACPGLDPGRKPVRVKKTRQIRNLEPGFDSIETERAMGGVTGML